MSTETQIVRALAPIYNKHLLGYLITKDMEASKLQKFIQEEVINNPKEANKGILTRLKDKSKRSGEDIPAMLGLDGISARFMESLTKEVGNRFMLSIHLLDSSRSKSDLSKGWHKRDRLLREIIHEEVQHVREEKLDQMRATDAITITQQFDKVLSKLKDIAHDIDGLYEEESGEESEGESSEEEESEDEERGRSPPKPVSKSATARNSKSGTKKQQDESVAAWMQDTKSGRSKKSNK